MEKPEIIWKDTYTAVTTERNLTSNDILKIDYPVVWCSRNKVSHWQTIRELYRYFRDQLQEKCQYKHLFVTLDGGAAPYEMTCAIYKSSHEVIWSQDVAIQEKIKEKFANWKEIESFYNYLYASIAETKENQKIDELFAEQWEQLQQMEQEQEAAEAQLKEERRKKYLQRDPTNPAARNQKARRHLERLGYTLHKSNKIRYYTADDKGQFKIVDASGKAVLGKKFDASIDDVEQFYTAQDKKRWSGRYGLTEEEQKPQRDLKREKKTAAQLKKYGFVLIYDEYYGYSIEDSLGYTMEHCKNIKKAEEIVEKLKKKGFKERESPVKQRKILHEFEEKITLYHDIWVKIGFDWKSTERNKGYMIVDRDKTLLGEKYSLTLDDIAAYIKKEGRQVWQRENTVRYQLRKNGYLLRQKKFNWKNYDEHKYQILDAATKEIVAGAETRLTLEEVESWILRDKCLEKST